MNRALDLARKHERTIVAVILAGLSLFYLLTTLPNIGNHPVVGGDEGWIISASAKLAEDGVFGSDLFAGFFGADEHYYFNLPLHHLVLAVVFKMAGVGLTQARLTSAVLGLALLALTYLLGRRLGGRWVGAGAAALVVLLRLNLAPFTGLTLTDLGATVRYDLIAVPFALAATLVLLAKVDSPRLVHCLLTGLVAGLGALTQFIAFFMAAPLALFLLTSPGEWKSRILRTGAFGLAFLAPFLPYAVYVAQDFDGFGGQARTGQEEKETPRAGFLSPGFYLDNLAGEVDRYSLALDLDSSLTPSEVAQRPSARLALLIAGPAALVYGALKAGRGSAAHRAIVLVLASLLVEFALLESTKRFVYWVIAVPFLCIAIADMAVALAAWRPPRSERGRVLRGLALAVTASIAIVVALEGVAIGVRNVGDARDAASYAAAGDAVRSVVPAGSRVVTDNRMWLALEDLEARSLLLLFYWTNPEVARDEVTDVEGAMRRIDADYLLLSPLSRENLRKLTPEDSARLERFLAEHASQIATVAGPPYGPFEVYELRP